MYDVRVRSSCYSSRNVASTSVLTLTASRHRRQSRSRGTGWCHRSTASWQTKLASAVGRIVGRLGWPLWIADSRICSDAPLAIRREGWAYLLRIGSVLPAAERPHPEGSGYEGLAPTWPTVIERIGKGPTSVPERIAAEATVRHRRCEGGSLRKVAAGIAAIPPSGTWTSTGSLSALEHHEASLHTTPWRPGKKE